MALNGISTLATKQLRQVAKLNLAQTKRKAGGNINAPAFRPYNTYNIALLPAQYIGNAAISNNNIGVVIHHPWV